MNNDWDNFSVLGIKAINTSLNIQNYKRICNFAVRFSVKE